MMYILILQKLRKQKKQYKISKAGYGAATDPIVNSNAELSRVLASTANGETA